MSSSIKVEGKIFIILRVSIPSFYLHESSADKVMFRDPENSYLAKGIMASPKYPRAV